MSTTTRKHRLIFSTMLLSTMTSTAVACSLIYGMLTGMLPAGTSPFQQQIAAAQQAGVAAAPVHSVRGTGTWPADFRASAEAAGGVVLLCRQAQSDVSGGAGAELRPGAGRLEPLVDKPERIEIRQGGEQFFF